MPHDTILLQYTGGTTGPSKGAELTNYNLVANTLQFYGFTNPFFKKKQQHVAMVALPVYHIYAFLFNCIGMMALGHKNILVTNPRD